MAGAVQATRRAWDRLRMLDAVGAKRPAREGLAFAVAPALELVEHRLPRGVPWGRFPLQSDAALQLAPVPLPVLWLNEGASAEERFADRAAWWDARDRATAAALDPWNSAVDARDAPDPERGLTAAGL